MSVLDEMPRWTRVVPMTLMLTTAFVLKETLDDENGDVSAAVLWGSLAVGLVVGLLGLGVLVLVYRNRRSA